MIEKILKRKVEEYGPRDVLDQENVLAEIVQHYVLASLSRAGFFKVAEFHGGTFLRIVHGLERFSEDLDFVLKEADSRFSWSKYLNKVKTDLKGEGLSIEIVDRSKAGDPVQKAMLKTGAMGEPLLLSLPFERHPGRKVRIKLEVDTAPPLGSQFETAYLNFPVTTAMTVQSLSSAFANKSHALLCRRYVKGRDWFDFVWYVDRNVAPHYELLANALNQVGPWAQKGTEVTPSWYLEQLGEVIAQVDWTGAQADVARFLPLKSRESITLWNQDFFAFHLKKLKRNLLAKRE